MFLTQSQRRHSRVDKPISLAVVAVGFLMATPFHAIGVAVGGDRGGEIGMTVWKMAMVIGAVVHVTIVMRSSRSGRSGERVDELRPDGTDGLALAESEDI